MAPEAAVSIDQTARHAVCRSKWHANGTTDLLPEAGGMMGAYPGALTGGAREYSSSTPGPQQRKAYVRIQFNGGYRPKLYNISTTAVTASIFHRTCHAD